jgi:hypothetical protein
VLLVAEVAVRFADPALVIPYSVPPFALEPECQAVIDHVDAFGPADVCFVGSSRVHQGIVVPEAQETCDGELTESLFVANYAVAGARARHVHAIVSYLLKNGEPRLILYGVSSRIMLGNRVKPDRRVALFWDLDDWWQHHQTSPDGCLGLLPVVIRNAVSKHFLTLRYRRTVPSAIGGIICVMGSTGQLWPSRADLLRGIRSPCPMRGETTYDHLYSRDKSLVTHPVPEDRAQAFLERTLVDGGYPMPQEHVESIAQTIRLCREAGVPIVLFELPIADYLHEHIPPGVVGEFRTRITDLCDCTGVPFFTTDKLGLTFTDADFLEYSHVNYHGASRITRALTEQAIIPTLKATGDHGGT